MKKLIVAAVALAAVAVQRADATEAMQIAYVQSVKALSQYIDTQYTPKADTTIAAEFQALDDLGCYVFGEYGSNNGRCQFKYSTPYFIGFGGTYDNTKTLTMDTNWHTIVLTNGVFSLDGIRLNALAYPWTEGSKSLYLFAANRNGAHEHQDDCSLRLRSIVISENGTVKCDLIAARVDDRVGFFDKTRQLFLENKGSGSFIAGADIGPLPGVGGEIVLDELTEEKLTAALQSANFLSAVVLPEGTLTLTKCCEINKPVRVRGSGNRATIVTMSSGKTDCAFRINNQMAELENVTIDGVAITGNTTAWNYKAAGVELDCGTLRNVTVRNCTSSDSGNVSAVLFPTCTDLTQPCLMENCTITNNDCGTTASYAIGTVCCRNAGAVIRNCEIAWNKAQGAAGLYLQRGMAEHCDIHHNEARIINSSSGSGGGLRMDQEAAVASIRCCAITNNTAAGDGGGVWLRGGNMVNCLIAKNSAARNGGGIIVAGSGGTATYCNIGGNRATGSGAGVCVNTDSADAAPTLRYNLIAQNGDDRANEISIANGKPTFAYSAMSKETFEVIGGGWIRELTKDPFRADGSYLTVDSADYEGIDDAEQGQSADEFTYPTVDFLGRSRPLPGFRISGSTVKPVARDIGCCEWDAHFDIDGKIYVSTTGSSVSPYVTPETAATNLNDALPLQAAFPSLISGIAVCPGTYDTKGMTEIPAGAVVFGNGPRGEVVFTSSETIAADKAILVVNGGTVSNLVVRGGVSVGSNVGAVPAASGVWVKKGLITDCEITDCKVLKANYEASGNCAQALVLGVMDVNASASAIAYGCKVYDNDGCFGTTSGIGNYPRASAVYVANKGRLERCEVMNNRGSPGGVTMVNVNSPGCSSLVDGCDIHDNFSYVLPGGILLGMSSCVWNTRIASNRVERNVNSLGGGVRGISMYCELVNCLIEGNEADVGGGLHTVCPGNRVIHCTIVGNKAGTAGGLHVENTGIATDQGLIQNTIIADNVSDSGDQVVYASGNFDVKNSLLANMPTGLIDGGGNLVGADPKFVNPAAHDWHLRKKSPCIDAGLADYPTPYATGKDYAADFDGTVRPQDGKLSGTPIPDMGCYEYVYTISKGMIIFVK